MLDDADCPEFEGDAVKLPFVHPNSIASFAPIF